MTSNIIFMSNNFKLKDFIKDFLNYRQEVAFLDTLSKKVTYIINLVEQEREAIPGILCYGLELHSTNISVNETCNEMFIYK